MSSLETYPFLKPTFWSFSLCELDTDIHKNLIIKQVLNHGDIQALTWLKSAYTQTDIETTIYNSMESEWSKKSLSLWSKIYNVMPQRVQRFR